jgi:hypothetical protein
MVPVVGALDAAVVLPGLVALAGALVGVAVLEPHPASTTTTARAAAVSPVDDRWLISFSLSPHLEPPSEDSG